jgi:hypothetical protein
MGKLINIFDNILLGGNAPQIASLKHFFGSPIDTPNVDFAAGLPFLYNLQSHSWLPCLDKNANPSFCRELTSPTVLFPRAKAFESKAKIIISNGGWANETESLTIALLNYLGYAFGFNKSPRAEPLYERAGLEGSGLDLKLWAWQYHLCTGTYINGQMGTSNHVVATWSLTMTELTFDLCLYRLRRLLTLLPITSRTGCIHDW